MDCINYLLKTAKLLTIVLTLFCSSSSANELVATLDPKASVLNELYKNEVPVSGKVIAGIGISGVDTNYELALFPNKSSDLGFACVQVMSRDGRYWAENTFVLPPVSSNTPIKLDYPSKYNDVLSGYDAEDLAILSFIGRCQKKGRVSYIVTSRQKLSDKGKSLIVYVNSARADAYIKVLSGGSSARRSKKCSKITEGRRTGYDTICRIDLSKQNFSEDSPVKLGIFRRKFNKNLKPVRILVSLPSLHN